MSKRSRGEAMLMAAKKEKVASGPRQDPLMSQSSINGEVSTSSLTKQQELYLKMPTTGTIYSEVTKGRREEGKRASPYKDTKPSSPQSTIKSERFDPELEIDEPIQIS